MISINKNIISFNALELEKFEEKIGYKLTGSYLNYLKEYNGGKPKSNRLILEFVNPSETLDFSVQFFYGLTSEEVTDLSHTYDVFSDRLPSYLIPVAMIEGGNLLCMNLTEEKYGSIIYYDHETECLFPVSQSFDEFLEILQPFFFLDGE
jgi:hypothetical protein